MIAGHWRRESFTAPGLEDRTTRVHWLQAPDGGFCDIRVPVTRPELSGAKALAELDAAALLGLMDAHGFAGTAVVAGDTCTWHRHIALHGSTADMPPDVGRLRFRPDGRLIEDGVAAGYREVWAREGGMAFRHRVWRQGARACHVTWSETEFLLAVGRPGSPDTLALRQALEAGRIPKHDAAAFFEGEYALGLWDGAEGRVTLATNPLREGHSLLARGDLETDQLRLALADFYGKDTPDRWTAV